MLTFGALLAAIGIVAGAVAAVAGFGIGSLLTPLLATAVGTRVLGRLPQATFRRVVAVLLLGLGVYMLAKGGGQ